MWINNYFENNFRQVSTRRNKIISVGRRRRLKWFWKNFISHVSTALNTFSIHDRTFEIYQENSHTKFRCVKTSISRVVEQSVSYEMTKKYRTKSVSFHLKYWPTTLLRQLATTVRLAGKIHWWIKQCACIADCTMNFSDVGTAHCAARTLCVS